MKKMRASVVLGCLILALVGTSPAYATQPEPSDGGSAVAPDNSQVTVGGASGSSVAVLSTVSAGGGTWQYGSYISTWPPKTCYSNYVHNSRYHSSTAVIGASNTKSYANAGYWSNASTWAGAGHTCNAYWNTY